MARETTRFVRVDSESVEILVASQRFSAASEGVIIESEMEIGSLDRVTAVSELVFVGWKQGWIRKRLLGWLPHST